MTAPPIALTVDGTRLDCKGAIAQLETVFVGLPSGSVARVFVNDVPTRIDLRAWAERKGHRVLTEARRDEVFELLIAKGDVVARPPVRGSGYDRDLTGGEERT